MIITVDQLNSYAVAKASQAAEHDDLDHNPKDCMICTQWAIVKQSDRLASLAMEMARSYIVKSLGKGTLSPHELARDFQVVWSLGLSAGVELTEAAELTKLEALGGE
jgi:hypothetical protein